MKRMKTGKFIVVGLLLGFLGKTERNNASCSVNSLTFFLKSVSVIAPIPYFAKLMCSLFEGFS